ncbi:prephenate dehydrogenase [Cephaloticoccus capnophilus]|nr:prephenate dehydrogenase/arogenate dehydrogenase family protein [Cephaloticoccus capnophilus]
MTSHLSIIAPGLLGASVAKAAHERKLAGRVSIWARRAEVRRAITQQPWCAAAPEALADSVREASLVVIAAPVTHIVPLICELAPQLPAGAIVTDVGSVKGEICRDAHAALVGTHAHFVGSHPMAGSEKTGWEHAQADLFEDRTCFVTPLIESDRHATETVSRFWQALGAKVVQTTPTAHDEIVAHISHLPHALAATLCAALGRKDANWPAYAGGGLRDTTRIAGSDPQLWRTIFEQNRDAILRALDHFEAELCGFRAALAAKDYDALTDTLARGRHYRQQF